MRIPLAPTAALAAASVLSLAAAQNPLPLNNGADFFYVSDTVSVGPPAGSGIVDPTARYDYRIYPRQALLSASGTLGLAGFRLRVLDYDATTPPIVYDAWIGRGVPSPAYPGAIVPDFSDPNALVVPGGPVSIAPGGCFPFPYTDTVVTVSLPCGAGGYRLPADGATDVAVVLFTPGGMLPVGGGCGFGTYSVEPWWSLDEKVAPILPSGVNPYAGSHALGTSEPYPAAVGATPVIELLFCEPMLSPRVEIEVGLIALHASVAGAPTFAYNVYDQAGVGQLAFAASSLHPPLAAPGVGLFGAPFLLDLGDPGVLGSLRTGSVKAGPGDPKFMSPYPLTVPLTAAGQKAWSQCLILDPLTFTARSTQVLETSFEP